MEYLDHFYIDGHFVRAAGGSAHQVINPATEEPVASIAMGTAEDVAAAVAAARRAFSSFGASSRADRLDLLKRILAVYDSRSEEFAQRMTLEMGTPISFSRQAQVGVPRAHMVEMIRVLEEFQFERITGPTMLAFEPIGVCALITPWNWPVLQIVTKVMPALAAGCTIVLKPSEYSPLSAMLFAEMLHEADVPAGVFNLVNGDGPTVGTAMSCNPDVDMVSFTGSSRAGILVAKNAADTVKRVHQELGGKSPNILLPDVDLMSAVRQGVEGCYLNGGQSCSAPTRMLVPTALHDEAAAIARQAAESFVVGDVFQDSTTLGPVINANQFERVNRLIQSGIDQGAELVTGGVGRPQGLNRGYFIKPTVFANVRQEMDVVREEIFGPVLCIQPYDTLDEAISMANDTVYGLAGYVQSADIGQARRVAAKLRAGHVHINYPAWDLSAPFGGYKQSGNGREYGVFGLDAFLEVKTVMGYAAT
jgi:aldehyde dehydrogenase (NAD+)